MAVVKKFKSKKKNHALQPNDERSIMFRLICMMAEKAHKKEYDEIMEEWNKDE